MSDSGESKDGVYLTRREFAKMHSEIIQLVGEFKRQEAVIAAARAEAERWLASDPITRQVGVIFLNILDADYTPEQKVSG